MRPSWGVRVIVVTGGIVVAGAISGCSPASDSTAKAAARAFVSAVERGDGATACKWLSKTAEQSASGATNVSCAKAIVSLSERGQAVGASQVWGDAAQVHIGGDVVFLRRYPAGWRVSAAGCVAQSAGPYDCTVS